MEQVEITYTEWDGIFYPDLKLPEHTGYEIGKYGRLHLAYLKKHCRGTYSQLVVECRLNEYLHEIDVQAQEMQHSIMERMARDRGIDEDLKARDAMRWVQEMNNIWDAAEEIVMREIVVAEE